MQNPPHCCERIRDGGLRSEPAPSATLRLGASVSALSRVLNGRGHLSPARGCEMEAIGWPDAVSWVQMQAYIDSPASAWAR